MCVISAKLFNPPCLTKNVIAPETSYFICYYMFFCRLIICFRAILLVYVHYIFLHSAIPSISISYYMTSSIIPLPQFSSNDLNLLSLNAKGLSNFRKRRTIFTWCRKRNSDIIFLQETHSTLSTQLKWKNEWGAELICSHGNSNSRGVAILIKKGLNCVIHSQIVDTSGRYIVVKAAIKDKMYVLVNIYAPSKDEDIIKFLKYVLTKLQTENLDSEENIVIGGDFNCPLNPTLDKKGGIMTRRKSVINCINDVQSQLDLVDIRRVKNPQTKSFTWSQRSPPIFCRLDYWLISNNLHDWVKATNIIPAIRTDHSAIYLECGNVYKEAKGPGFWKMNTSILEDDEYIDDLTKMVPIWIAEGRKDLSDHRNI